MSSPITFRDGDRRSLTGIAGWLALMGLGQTFTPLLVLSGAFKDWESLQPYFAKPIVIAAARGVAYADAALVLITLFVTVAFWMKKASFPALYTAQWLLLSLYPFGEAFYLSTTLSVSLASLVGSILGQTVGPSVGGLLWVAYVHRSKRVKNTFVR